MGGCTDPSATNYNEYATIDDQSCDYEETHFIVTIEETGESTLFIFQDIITSLEFGDELGLFDENGIIDSIMGIDGSGGDYLYMPAGGSLNPATEETIKNNLHYVKQDGPNVFKQAVKGMTDITLKIVHENKLDTKDIDLFIPHQANKRIIELVGNKLNLKDTQILINIDKYANTTAATIPIAMHDAVNNKQLQDNNNLIISTFGAGFTWGAMYINWNLNG